MMPRQEPHQPLRSPKNLNRLARATELAAQWPGEESKSRRDSFSPIRSLPVPLDGSKAAEHALPHALALARRTGATVRLVHVHSVMRSVKPWHLYIGVTLIERLRRQKQAYLQSVVNRVNRICDVRVAATLIESDEIADSLCEAVAGATLVVMANHGRSFVRRLLHGSMSSILMQEVARPLLIIRGHDWRVDLTTDPIPRHILLPLDGTKVAEEIIDPAATLGRLFGAKITLAHFQDARHRFGKSDDFDVPRYLSDTALQLSIRRPGVRTHIEFCHEQIDTAILGLAHGQNVDLIAVTTHGRNGLARLLKPSVAPSLVRKTTTPPLVLRPSL